MGILNVTPDSFSDGGRFHSLESALSRAEEMIDAGVDIIDIGGESTRPGAVPLSLEEELRRVLPVVFALRDCGKPLSIDTYKPRVMIEALAAGADMINDVSGFRQPEALIAIKHSDCALCIMHMSTDPQSMQRRPAYQDVVKEVNQFLLERISELDACGVARARLCIDPGFGFGKTLEHNIALLKNLRSIAAAAELPLLAGLSRKSMIGDITGKTVDRRLAGSIAAAIAATANGAAILRVHDVPETIDALKVWRAAI
ncbi:dihydropteroate synthase [Actimicrobium antarcticum]|uniref:dihydropteroate synthase n=2 Tax=Actimicrobium antarcticum TaxID=1051899 RepID=A0ABP7STM8_9BURK